MNVHPRWIHHIQARVLPELESLGADIEINEAGLMCATWPQRESIQSDVIVALQVLPVKQFNTGWMGSGKITLDRQAHRFVMLRQLRF